MLVRCLAAAVLYNSMGAWGDLFMLLKTVLRVPQNPAKDDAIAAFTRDRLEGGRLVKGALSGLMLLASGPKAGLSILRSSNASELKL